jgi:HAMP domain-containing protein
MEPGTRMKLLTKFNLILIVIFGASGFLLSQLAYSFLIGNARREVMTQAELMMESAKSVRDYTSTDVGPLLEKNPRHKVRFLAETIPFFAATATFNNLRKSYPDFSYKEAALNPTNLEDRSTDWESDIIRNLRDHPDQAEMTGDRQTSSGPAIFIAKPIRATPECLQCHSIPSIAPPAMVLVYGSSNGFGWRQNEIVGAQIISVPLSVPMARANQAYHTLLVILISTLVATILALDAGLYWLVIRPLRMVSDTADRISRGDKNVIPLTPTGKDEIASVTSSLNRIQLSPTKAPKTHEEDRAQ